MGLGMKGSDRCHLLFLAAAAILVFQAVPWAWGEPAFPQLAESRVSVPYGRELREMGDLEEFRLDLYGKEFAIQDLGKGRLILADSSTGRISSDLAFPPGIACLFFSPSGKVFGLASDSIAEFPSRAALLLHFQDHAGAPAPARRALKGGPDFSGERKDYQFHVDPEGFTLVWDKAKATLFIFGPAGEMISSYACQSGFVPSGRRGFVSAFFSPEHGSRLCEFGYFRPETSSPKSDSDLFSAEIQLPDRNEVRVLSFDSTNNSALVMLFPPSISETAPVLSEGEAQERMEKGSTDFTRDPRFAWFIDRQDPSAMLMVLARVDSSGRLTPLGSFPFAATDGTTIVGRADVSVLVPGIPSGTFELKSLEICRKTLSEGKGR